jgi:hypothetical protein
MSIFLTSYQHTKIRISHLSSFVAPTYSLPQQEIIPIGKNVFLHALYQEVPEPLPEHTELPGDFIIYKTSNGIVICIYDATMPVEQRRIFQFDVYPSARLVTYKTLKYTTDKVKAKKLECYNSKGRHPIIAYGKCKLDTKTQYNLYGYRFIKNIPNEVIEGNLFKMTFITSKSNQHFTEHATTSAYLEGDGNSCNKLILDINKK